MVGHLESPRREFSCFFNLLQCNLLSQFCQKSLFSFPFLSLISLGKIPKPKYQQCPSGSKKHKKTQNMEFCSRTLHGPCQSCTGRATPRFSSKIILLQTLLHGPCQPARLAVQTPCFLYGRGASILHGSCAAAQAVRVFMLLYFPVLFYVFSPLARPLPLCSSCTYTRLPKTSITHRELKLKR